MPSTRKLVVLVAAATLLGAGAGAAERPEFRDWPAGTSPREVGKRVAENFVVRPFERPTRFIIYPEVCAWYGSLTLAQLIGDTDLRDRLVRKFDPLLTPEGSKNISPDAHVDYRVFGAVPLEIYLQTKDPRFLELGRSFADKQWETTTPDGITAEARYWIDDMFMITAVQVQAYRATGDAKYLDRAALAMVAYLDRLQQPNGLFFHAPDSRYYWSRGNGWMAAGTAELLRALPKKHPRRARILEGYQRMMASLVRYQGEDGLWRQLLDEPDGLAGDLGHGNVHLRDGHRREERVAGRQDLRPGGAAGLAGAREAHRREGQRPGGVRGDPQGLLRRVLPLPPAQRRRPARPGPDPVERLGSPALTGTPPVTPSVRRARS